ncbi:MAG: response regulator [Elusimicrobia bacterium]|nr:response regulator [Elusimicrobiota bacterium]
MDVLVFDDDPYCAELVSELLTEDGFAFDKFLDGARALEFIRNLKPRLVVLDVMMPGMDGLSICKALKSDPRTKAIKVVVVSGKAYEADQAEARRCGADHFVAKPYDTLRLREVFTTLLGSPQPAPADGPSAGPVSARVRIWGSRAGDGAAPALPTACVSLEFGQRLVILDAGTGLRGLCAAPPPAHKDVWLFLTHYHEDHVNGLPALAAAFDPSYSVSVTGPNDTRLPLGQLLTTRVMSVSPRARFKAFQLAETSFPILEDVRVSTMYTMHPGATLAYRFDYRGRSVVYCPDNELEDPGQTQTDFGEKLARFLRGADLLIHDARFSDEDYPGAKGRGHGCPSRVIELAIREGVRRLALFHADERYGAVQLEAALARARQELQVAFKPLVLDLALPGAVYEL